MNRFSLAMLMLLTIAANALRSPAANPATQPQPATFAERHLQISGDPNSVDGVLQHCKILSGPRNVPSWSGLGPDYDVKMAVNFGTKSVDLSLKAANPQADANEAIDRITRTLVREFTSSSQSRVNQIGQDEDEFQTIRAHIEDLKNRHDAEEAQLRKQTGAVDVSPASVRERMSSLQTQKESATIELAAKQARSDALAEQISKFSGQIQDKIKNDPIAAELSKVVEARQKEFDQVQTTSKAGEASPTEVDQAMASLAEAKAKFLEAGSRRQRGRRRYRRRMESRTDDPLRGHR